MCFKVSNYIGENLPACAEVQVVKIYRIDFYAEMRRQMKWKQQSNRVTAWCLTVAMCLSMLFSFGQPAVAKAEELSVTLSNPVIEAEKGYVQWDCIYFGNYWQEKYIPQPGNMPEEGEEDVVHIDDDGTRYIVRTDKSCYKYEPLKWRILSVSEDGTDAFVMADKTLDGKALHSNYSETVTTDTVTWENSDVREWLNHTFMETAFSEKEQEAIAVTEIDNLSYSSYYGGDLEDGTPTEDRIYLPSLDDMVNREYGFVNNFNPTDDPTLKGFSATQTRQADSTDFAQWGEEGYKAKGYLLRTPGAFQGYILRAEDDGEIPTDRIFSTTVDDEGHGIRPVLHLDLTKTELWKYAGRVRQDKTEIAPDAPLAVPTEAPTVQPGVTMAPGQVYPKNPVVYPEDLSKNTWDCIYFGKYYNTKIIPSALAQTWQDDTLQVDENGEYFVSHEKGYFLFEPIKWRVLSINEEGTDAFLMADQVLELAPYSHQKDVEVTWEKSDVRQWLNTEFLNVAFSDAKQEKILNSTVTTADNKWSGESGGNDTTDKIYLPSIEELLDTVYGFSSDEKEGDTRRHLTTDYAKAEENLDWVNSDPGVYWLRSPGSKKGCPATVGFLGDGEILTENDKEVNQKVGVRPVMHVDLSDTALWTYAGQVTPAGVVVPKEEAPEQTEPPVQTEPEKNPQQAAGTKIKRPGKPAIKKLKNLKGKKVSVILSKKISGVTGYQVAYAAKSSMKGQKKKFFKGSSVTVKGLKKKKTYYFRVRAYVKQNGKTVYGSWGNKKNIKIKK